MRDCGWNARNRGGWSPPGHHSAAVAAGVCPRLQTTRRGRPLLGEGRSSCWAAGRTTPARRTSEDCSGPQCLMATAASLLPAFLPAFLASVLPPCLPSVRLSPPAGGSVRPESEGASQRGRSSCWAAGRTTCARRTSEACSGPECLMATAASLLPAFLPTFLPSVLPPCLPSVRL